MITMQVGMFEKVDYAGSLAHHLQPLPRALPQQWLWWLAVWETT